MNSRSLIGALMAIIGLGCGHSAAVKQTVPAPSTARSVSVPPFQMIGNIYYVGTTDVAIYLIKTSDGLILLDGGYEETAPEILQSIRALGFDPADIRVLLNSHAHYDHAGGLAALKQSTGAPLYAGRADSSVLARGGKNDPGFGDRYPFPSVTVDHAVSDGDRVILGSDTLVAVATPGHTQGCTTWSMSVRDGGQTYPALFICSLSIPGYDLKNHPPYPAIVADYRASIARLRSLACEAWFMPHAGQFGLDEKLKHIGGGTNPFIDQAGCRAMLAEAGKNLEKAVAK